MKLLLQVEADAANVTPRESVLQRGKFLWQTGFSMQLKR